MRLGMKLEEHARKMVIATSHRSTGQTEGVGKN